MNCGSPAVDQPVSAVVSEYGSGTCAMRLRYRLIGTLAAGVTACACGILAAAAQSGASESSSSKSWTLCTSRDVALADQAIAACSAIIAASPSDSAAQLSAYGHRGIALFRRA